MNWKALAIGIAAAGAFCTVGAQAQQAWPQKPVKVVVPFGPGGTTDIFGRLIQRAVQEQNLLSQPMTIVNVGGHFSVGSIQAKNAEPDGYTFLLIHLALLSGEIVDPGRNLSFRDFEPVALTGGFCLHHIVHDESPHKSLQDLIAAAKAKPRSVVFGVNIGALNHMGGGYLERAADAKFRFVQIGGGAENFAAIKGKTIETTMLSASEYANFKGGGVRALADTGPARLENQPEVPTVKEAGLNYQFCINNFWFAPKGTPKAAVDGMVETLRKAMASPVVIEGQKKQSSTTDFIGGEEFRAYLDKTYREVEPIARELVRR
ncbi:MAG: Bug family tripartite tricarboxylate transporter substrate binding protein [Beijerinckiaceae bacterium]